MRGAQPRLIRAAAWPLIVAFALAMSAECLAMDEMTPEQKACCAAMGHDCGDDGTRPDCCTTIAPQETKFSALKIAVVPAPVLNVVAVLAPSVPAAALVTPRAMLDLSNRRPPGVPAYVLTSTFRI